MSRYEYKVVPAPAKGLKSKGVKTPEGRFAASIQTVLNQMAAGGWEFQRAELLPSEERAGLTGTTTKWRNLLVFRRAAADPVADMEPRLLPLPDASGPRVGPAVAAPSSNAPAVHTEAPHGALSDDDADMGEEDGDADQAPPERP